MAEVQVSGIEKELIVKKNIYLKINSNTKDHSKNKNPFFSTPKSYSRLKLLRE